MAGKRRDRLSMLEDAVRAITPAPVTDIGAQIALLEMIIPAEMCALIILRDVIHADPIKRHGTIHDPAGRRKTAPELQAQAVEFEAARRVLANRVQELRRLTGDDDAAWQARYARLQAECNRMAGRHAK